MIKKILISFLCVAALFVCFHEEISQLADRAVRFVPGYQLEDEAPEQEYAPAAMVLPSGAVELGDDAETVMERFGEAADTFASEYGFTWYAYHQNYENYIQIGIDETGKVCAIYTNAPQFAFDGLRFGAEMEEVRALFGEPMEKIRKGNTVFILSNEMDGRRETDLFLHDGMYLRVFYDCLKNNTVTAVHIIEEGREQAFARQYAEGTPELARALEKENFNVTNALRVREGLHPVHWSEEAAQVARSHSKDMAENDYFSHTDRNGGSVLDRLKNSGLKVSGVGENLAAGGQNGAFMHELLMNSEGHRENILGEYYYLGVGVAFNQENRPYLTQNYYNPPKILVG